LIGSVVVAAAVAMAGCASMDVHRVQEPGPPAETAALDEALNLVSDGRYEEAAARLEPLASRLERSGRTDLAAQALFWQAYCFEKDGRLDQATDLYNRVVRSHPLTRAAQQAAERLDIMKSTPGR